MRHFYLALLEGDATAPEALRSAQLAIRNERRWAEPFYWAPFVLQGNGT
jgi:CHAT domain-containing protein